MVLEHITTGTTGLKTVGFKDDSLLLPMLCCHVCPLLYGGHYHTLVRVSVHGLFTGTLSSSGCIAPNDRVIG